MKHTIVMTGASRGLGFHAAVALLGDDPELHLVVTVRGTGGEDLSSDLAERSGNRQVTAVPADLASFASIRGAADDIVSRVLAGELPALTGFVGNAGLQYTSAARSSKDGFEATFAVNVLANHLLVRLLAPHLVAPARVVLTTSDTHFGDFAHTMGMVPAPRWTDAGQLSRPGPDTVDAGRAAYSTSKLGVVYLAHALARRVPEGVDVVSFNPGLVPGTGLARDAGPVARAMFRAVLPLLRVTSMAQSPARAGRQLADTVAGRVPAPTGSYVDRTAVTPSSDASYDRDREDELWRTATALTGGASPPEPAG